MNKCTYSINEDNRQVQKQDKVIDDYIICVVYLNKWCALKAIDEKQKKNMKEHYYKMITQKKSK